MTKATTNPEPSLRARALAYLARREYSLKELRHKLLGFATEDDDLDALLQDFKQRGWLSDERFAEQVVHARQGRYGSLKVAHELREKGVADSLVDQATAALDDMQNARHVWQKKYGKLPASREEWAKQARFLQSRGFGFDVIKRVLNSAPDDDTSDI
ncbi:MAG TPA: recombination regulator RecX [Methylophilaceae bacterium]|nr:recombination regulator RecX [Methylophilaceae bacterium]